MIDFFPRWRWHTYIFAGGSPKTRAERFIHLTRRYSSDFRAHLRRGFGDWPLETGALVVD